MGSRLHRTTRPCRGCWSATHQSLLGARGALVRTARSHHSTSSKYRLAQLAFRRDVPVQGCASFHAHMLSHADLDSFYCDLQKLPSQRLISVQGKFKVGKAYLLSRLFGFPGQRLHTELDSGERSNSTTSDAAEWLVPDLEPRTTSDDAEWFPGFTGYNNIV